MKVTITSLGGDFEERTIGTIEWRGQALLLDPPDSEALREVLRIPAPDADGHPIDSLEHPGAWLANIYRGLCGSHLRASRPGGGTPPPEPAEL